MALFSMLFRGLNPAQLALFWMLITTKQTITDYFNAWHGKIICWGGLPSVIFDSSYPMHDYKSHVRDIAKTVEERNDFIFGASDHVMPGAEWERLTYLAKVAGTME